MDNFEPKYYTLITGASCGLGKSFSYECAARKRNLILVALPHSGLEEMQIDLQNHYSIQVKIYPIDLTIENSAQMLFDWCQAKELNVDMLINNAGLSHVGYFDSIAPWQHDEMIFLNIRSVVLLTRYFLTELKKHPNGFILNVGSMASFLPIPYKCVYAASKSFIYYFSQGLQQELKGTKVKVGVLCPGPIETNNKVKARIKAVGKKGQIITLPAKEVAQIAITQLLKGKTLIVPGFINRLFLTIYNIMPKIIVRKVVEKAFRNESIPVMEFEEIKPQKFQRS